MREWLPGLNARQKWFQTQRDAQIGDVMLVISPDTSRELAARTGNRGLSGMRQARAGCVDPSRRRNFNKTSGQAGSSRVGTLTMTHRLKLLY